MGGTLENDSAAAAVAAARLSPLYTFVIVFALQLLDGFLDRLKKRGVMSSEETQLRQEIKRLLKEASSLSTPSTFAQAAKLRRMATAKEKELLRMNGEHNKETKGSYDLYMKSLMTFKVFSFIVLIWLFWGTPVAALPQHLLQPFGRVLSWRAGNILPGHIMVGIVPWLVLTSRVSKFLCQKLWKKYRQQ